jgi:hypothetical protein
METYYSSNSMKNIMILNYMTTLETKIESLLFMIKENKINSNNNFFDEEGNAILSLEDKINISKLLTESSELKNFINNNYEDILNNNDFKNHILNDLNFLENQLNYELKNNKFECEDSEDVEMKEYNENENEINTNNNY